MKWLLKYIIIILMIFLILYLLTKNEYNIEKKLKIDIKCSKPNVLQPQKKEIILNPVDKEYYNKLKSMRELLRERRIKNYNMNKETINNEVANVPELPAENVVFERIELRVPDEINLNNFNNNSQNVHDSTVQDTIKVKYTKLKKEDVNVNNVNVNVNNVNEIKDYIKKNKLINKFKSDRLIFILNEINTRNSKISNLGDASELDILNLVWKKEKWREQIINELLDCYNGEYNNIVCPTGVVTRLLNTDVVLNPETTPRTIEMLRTEMLNIAAQVRNKCEMDANYLKETEEEQDKYLKERIKEKMNETYNGILSSEVIQKELDSWLENL